MSSEDINIFPIIFPPNLGVLCDRSLSFTHYVKNVKISLWSPNTYSDSSHSTQQTIGLKSRTIAPTPPPSLITPSISKKQAASLLKTLNCVSIASKIKALLAKVPHSLFALVSMVSSYVPIFSKEKLLLTGLLSNLDTGKRMSL